MAGVDGQASGVAVPIDVRVVLARAAVQVVADDADVDMLHIKGEVVDPRLKPAAAPGTDVDALVRPTQVSRMHAALVNHGWSVYSTFDHGSPFGHAQTYQHDMWGYFDLHRRFPGIRLDDGDAFELMWGGRSPVALQGADGWAPSLVVQATLLVLNDARRRGPRGDSVQTWITEPGLDPNEIAGCVAALGAQTAFAAATGTLERRRGAPDYALWRAVSQGGSRTAEWWGRIRAASGPGEAVELAAKALLVNVEQLQHDLGRPPTRREIAVAFVSRLAHGVRELGARLTGGSSS